MKQWNKIIKNLKFDKTTLELLAIAISFIGLFASIFNISYGTEYYAILGHDLKHHQADIINDYVSIWFLIWSSFGVVLQMFVLVFDIGDNNRTMSKKAYFIVSLIFIILSIFIALFGKGVSGNLARNDFKKEIVKEYSTTFEEFDFMLAHEFLKPTELKINDENEKARLKGNNKSEMENQFKYIEELIKVKYKIDGSPQDRYKLIKEKLNFESIKKRIK